MPKITDLPNVGTLTDSDLLPVVDAEGLSGSRAKAVTALQLRNYVLTDAGVQYVGPQGPQGATGPQGAQGLQGSQGDKGWAPVFSLVTDSSRRVLKLVDYTGGAGTKPTVPANTYIGATGLTAVLANAVDVRGPDGPQGPQGNTGAQGLQGIQGPKGDTGNTGAQGIQGPKGDKGDKGDPGSYTASPWTQIGSTVTVSTPVATVDFTNIPATYTDLMLVYTGLSHDGVSNQSITLRCSSDNGTSYSNTGAVMAPSVPNTSLYGGYVLLDDYSNILKTRGRAVSIYQDDATSPPATATQSGTSGYKLAGILNALRAAPLTSGNIDAGTFTLYGR